MSCDGGRITRLTDWASNRSSQATPANKRGCAI